MSHAFFADTLSEYGYQENEHYRNVLEKNRDTIIQSLGGLSNILDLCLTHEKATQRISNDSILHLQNILLPQLSHQSPTSANNEIEIIDSDPDIIDHDTAIASNSNSNASINISKNKTNTSHDHDHRYSAVDLELEHTILIPTLTIDATANLYFILFDSHSSHREIAKYIFYNVILSKWYPIILFGLYFVTYIIVWFLPTFINIEEYLLQGFRILYYFIILIGATSYLFAINIKVSLYCIYMYIKYKINLCFVIVCKKYQK